MVHTGGSLVLEGARYLHVTDLTSVAGSISVVPAGRAVNIEFSDRLTMSDVRSIRDPSSAPGLLGSGAAGFGPGGGRGTGRLGCGGVHARRAAAQGARR